MSLDYPSYSKEARRSTALEDTRTVLGQFKNKITDGADPKKVTPEQVKTTWQNEKISKEEKALWNKIDKGKRTLSDWKTKCTTEKGKKQIIKEMKCIVQLYMDYYNDNDEMMRENSPCDKIKIAFAIQVVGELIAEDLHPKEGKKGSRGNQAKKIIQDNQDTIISKIVATKESDIGILEKRSR